MATLNIKEFLDQDEKRFVAPVDGRFGGRRKIYIDRPAFVRQQETV